MTADRISELVAAGESETLEFKRTTGQPTPGDQAWSLRANGTAGLSLATTGRTGGCSPPGPGRPLVSLGPPRRIAREGGGVKPGLQDGNSGCHDGGSARVLPRCQRRAKRRLPNGPGSSQRLTGLRRRRRDRVRGGPNCGWPGRQTVRVPVPRTRMHHRTLGAEGEPASNRPEQPRTLKSRDTTWPTTARHCWRDSRQCSARTRRIWPSRPSATFCPGPGRLGARSPICCRLVVPRLVRVDRIRTQAAGEDGAKPDLAGWDQDDQLRVLIEAKFWAGLTAQQPVVYLRTTSEGSTTVRAPVRRPRPTAGLALGGVVPSVRFGFRRCRGR